MENGAGFCWTGVPENDREPKASPNPPRACAFDWGCAGEARGGDCMPPKAFAAGCGGGAAGFDAYSDKIDCFKSDLPGAPGVLGPVLEGRAGSAD